MKKRSLSLGVGLIALTAAVGTDAKAGQGGIPYPIGQFAASAHGSFAVRVDPMSFAGETCATAGALVLPLITVFTGLSVTDAAGNACDTLTEVDSALPPNASPPIVTTDEHVTAKVTDYNSATGIGNLSFTAYTGGSCHGAKFDSTGATELSSGIDNFVVSENGNRVDLLVTSLTNPSTSIGSFDVSAISLRQR